MGMGEGGGGWRGFDILNLIMVRWGSELFLITLSGKDWVNMPSSDEIMELKMCY